MAKQVRQVAKSRAEGREEAEPATPVARLHAFEPPPPPENDNEAKIAGLSAEVRFPADLPVLPVEIEVIAALLDDWDLGSDENEG